MFIGILVFVFLVAISFILFLTRTWIYNTWMKFIYNVVYCYSTVRDFIIGLYNSVQAIVQWLSNGIKAFSKRLYTFGKAIYLAVQALFGAFSRIFKK